MCQQRLLKKILTQNKFTSTLGDKKNPEKQKKKPTTKICRDSHDEKRVPQTSL